MISRVTKSKWLPIVAGLYESPWRRASIGVAVLLAVVLLSSCDDGTTVLPTAIPQTISATSTPGQVPPTLMPEPTRTTLPESTPSQMRSGTEHKSYSSADFRAHINSNASFGPSASGCSTRSSSSQRN